MRLATNKAAAFKSEDTTAGFAISFIYSMDALGITIARPTNNA